MSLYPTITVAPSELRKRTSSIDHRPSRISPGVCYLLSDQTLNLLKSSYQTHINHIRELGPVPLPISTSTSTSTATTHFHSLAYCWILSDFQLLSLPPLFPPPPNWVKSQSRVMPQDGLPTPRLWSEQRTRSRDNRADSGERGRNGRRLRSYNKLTLVSMYRKSSLQNMEIRVTDFAVAKDSRWTRDSGASSPRQSCVWEIPDEWINVAVGKTHMAVRTWGCGRFARNWVACPQPMACKFGNI